MKQERTYETEKAAHEKTRLERNEAAERARRLLGTVRGLEAKVKHLEVAVAEANETAAFYEGLWGEAIECVERRALTFLKTQR